jgi:hypothetical protein
LQPFEQRVDIRFARVKRSEEIEGFAHGNLVGKIRCLEAGADPIFQLLLLPFWIEVEHFHFAGGAGTKALQDFYRGSLARAIWAEQTEDLSGSHLEIDTLHGFEVAVRFSKSSDVDNELGTHRVS